MDDIQLKIDIPDAPLLEESEPPKKNVWGPVIYWAYHFLLFACVVGIITMFFLYVCGKFGVPQGA
jgi:hypothetical protein